MFSIIFSGYLTKDATVRTNGETSVLNFTVAVNFPSGKKDAQGEDIKETVFLSCSKWSKGFQQSNLANYLKRGQRVIIVGNQMKISENDFEGKTYHNINIFVQSIELIGGSSSTHQEEHDRGAEPINYQQQEPDDDLGF